MSTSDNGRRPLRLKVDAEPVADKPWKVRTQDGQVRGPLGIEQIRSLAEVALLTPDAAIAPAQGGDDSWQPVEGHQVWEQVRTAFPRKKAKRIETDTSLPTEVVVGDIPRAITPAMHARLTEARRRETHKLWRGVWLGQTAGLLRAVREVVVFFGFIAAGDLLTAFVPSGLGIVRWGILMVVTAVALGYYILRGLGR